jgi:hypothetical protein
MIRCYYEVHLLLQNFLSSVDFGIKETHFKVRNENFSSLLTNHLLCCHHSLFDKDKNIISASPKYYPVLFVIIFNYALQPFKAYSAI